MRPSVPTCQDTITLSHSACLPACRAAQMADCWWPLVQTSGRTSLLASSRRSACMTCCGSTGVPSIRLSVCPFVCPSVRPPWPVSLLARPLVCLVYPHFTPLPGGGSVHFSCPDRSMVTARFTIGHAWTTDFGDPDDREAFEYILQYSPIHNVRVPVSGTHNYPAYMITTGEGSCASVCLSVCPERTATWRT
jgi:hypothetical protein